MDRNWCVIFFCILIEIDDHFCCVRKCENFCKTFLPDYYNYYYGGCYQNPEGADTQESSITATVDAADGNEATADGNEAIEVTTPNEAAAADVSGQPDSTAAVPTEVILLCISCRAF